RGYRVGEVECALRGDQVRKTSPAHKIAGGLHLILKSGNGSRNRKFKCSAPDYRISNRNAAAGLGKCDLPNALVATVLDDIDPVANDLRVDRRGKATDELRHPRLIVGAA